MEADPELTAEQEDRVRRLLADARHDEGVPDDVAARLDHVLAGLADGTAVDERADDGAGVTSLAAHRRRRASYLLVAAAAVVVTGFGVGQVTTGSDVESAATSADDGAGGSMATEERAMGGTGEWRSLPAPAESVPTVDPDHFTRDVGRLSWPDTSVTLSSGAAPEAEAEHFSLRNQGGNDASKGNRRGELSTHDGDVPTDDKEDSLDLADGSAVATCGPGPYGAGRLVTVLYKNRPAVLAYRKRSGDHQVVELLQCDTGTVLRSVTLPLP